VSLALLRHLRSCASLLFSEEEAGRVTIGQRQSYPPGLPDVQHFVKAHTHPIPSWHAADLENRIRLQIPGLVVDSVTGHILVKVREVSCPR